MEIKVTHLVNEASSMIEYSASVAELGENAGRETWDNAVESAEESPLLTTVDDLQVCKDWLAEFGAWDDDEINAWTPAEVNALLLQFIAGNIREAMPALVEDYAEYRRMEEAGQISGGLYKCDIVGNADFGEWFFYCSC